jgi:DNA-binding XRE family transcriptional regulator
LSAELNPTSLRVELALRGWTNAKLADTAGVSRATVTAALKGQSIAATSVYKIGIALKLHPPIEGLAALVERRAS